MALILKLLEKAKEDPKNNGPMSEEQRSSLLINRLKCRNARCISTVEQELDQLFRVVDAEKGICRCVYCDSKEKI